MAIILITGATGFIGRHLVPFLIDKGYRLVLHVRDQSRAEKLFSAHISKASTDSGVTFVQRFEDIKALPHIDAVINLAGEPIADKLWTSLRRAELRNSRVVFTKGLAHALLSRQQTPRLLISASAAGYYGRRGAETLLEEEEPQDIFMSHLCADWEAAAMRAARGGYMRVIMPRLGVVLGKGGGALSPMLLPARFGLGTVMGAGDNYFPWIHMDDVLAAIAHLLTHEFEGPINLVAPETVTQATFQKVLAKAIGRPQFLKIPAPIVKTLLGEMSDLFLAGQHMSSARLLDSGYQFKYSTLAGALADLTTL